MPEPETQYTRAPSKRDQDTMPEQTGRPLEMSGLGQDGPTDDWCISKGRNCGPAPARCCKGLKCETMGEPGGLRESAT
ncbi:hypothetical protein AJ78_06930 [Emergomyces pasteurianus Ep9510]|uniref:Uncharacterized protein n=1 Tax=Emergomyces pasteurianus Ep9510 TaxID=1447872 RepID=A0A1J9Q985_9EURO|nr:hypothetical protein AJ78_06930 [Emergomyces pasteurianus Ep9510]